MADRLADKLKQRYGVRSVGTYSPPFRPLSEDEKTEVELRIQAAAPDVVWVGLSTPKQERWMFEHRSRQEHRCQVSGVRCQATGSFPLSVPVMAGVGAAFDFLAGTARQAPVWMQENGLEWLFRLAQEPRRLGRRYLGLGSKFAWNVALELLGVKKFE